MIRLNRLDPDRPEQFPSVELALDDPDGLLAIGGDLTPTRLLAAYQNGIFPWYSHEEPILWWSPARRTVFDTAHIHVPRRLARWLRQCRWQIRADSAFTDVITACAAPRVRQRGTWINAAMIDAYARLNAHGFAHSIEVWCESELVGGIYGVAIGRMFFGESMFSTMPNASKVALLALGQVLHSWSFPLLDAQVASPHLFTLGALEMSRAVFCARVAELSSASVPAGSWIDSFPSIHPAQLA